MVMKVFVIDVPLNNPAGETQLLLNHSEWNLDTQRGMPQEINNYVFFHISTHVYKTVLIMRKIWFTCFLTAHNIIEPSVKLIDQGSAIVLVKPGWVV